MFCSCVYFFFVAVIQTKCQSLAIFGPKLNFQNDLNVKLFSDSPNELNIAIEDVSSEETFRRFPKQEKNNRTFISWRLQQMCCCSNVKNSDNFITKLCDRVDCSFNDKSLGCGPLISGLRRKRCAAHIPHRVYNYAKPPGNRFVPPPGSNTIQSRTEYNRIGDLKNLTRIFNAKNGDEIDSVYVNDEYEDSEADELTIENIFEDKQGALITSSYESHTDGDIVITPFRPTVPTTTDLTYAEHIENLERLKTVIPVYEQLVESEELSEYDRLGRDVRHVPSEPVRTTRRFVLKLKPSIGIHSSTFVNLMKIPFP